MVFKNVCVSALDESSLSIGIGSIVSLAKINPSSLHSEGKSNDIQGNPHLVRALSCQRSMVIHGQISPLKSTLVLTYLKLHYTTKVGISTDRPDDSHAVFRRVWICWDFKKVQFNFVLITGIYSDFQHNSESK